MQLSSLSAQELGIYGGSLANLKITEINFKSANKIKMDAINVNTLKILNNGIIIFKSSRFHDYNTPTMF